MLSPWMFTGKISVDFSQQTYDWDAMSPTQATAEVQKLLYHAGCFRPDGLWHLGFVSFEFQYTNRTAFLLSLSRLSTRMVWRSNYTPEEWDNLVRAELSEGRPVIYRGQGAVGGHAFNVDGVQDQNWFHINWGWGGSYNGYFLLDDLSPGTGLSTLRRALLWASRQKGWRSISAPLVSPLYLEIQRERDGFPDADRHGPEWRFCDL
jgi:hypothetical protein